jgi:hypothetical protein
MTVQHERFPLPDDSVMLVEPIPGSPGALICREVDGEVVWGQAFSHPTEMDRVLREVHSKMTANPGNFLSAWRRGVYPRPEVRP